MSVAGVIRAFPRGEGRSSGAVRRLYRLLAAESLVVVLCAACVFFFSFSILSLLGNDSWMTIVWGREIAAHGIPYDDALTVMTHGKAWVDQQWLTQLVFWEIFRAGGIKLALLVTIALLVTPITVATVLARRRGASVTSILPFALLPLFNFSSILRAQLFSQLLFVLLLALLLAESRSRSRRVLLAFPLLVVWANMHGAALVGAGLVSVLGLHELLRLVRRPSERRPRTALRGAALVVFPWLCLLATPFGVSTAAYYHTMFSNPILHSFEGEWKAPVLASWIGFPVFVLAAAAIALAAGRRRDLNVFEIGALALTLVGALLAVRSIPWFAYACLVLLPPLVERTWRKRTIETVPTALGFGVAVAAASIACAGVALIFHLPASRLTPMWPDAAAAAVTDVLRHDPDARVFASYEYPDWLLLVSPPARGRVAYDGRFEVLTQRQLASVFGYLRDEGKNPERPTDGYRLLVLNPLEDRDLVGTYAHRAGVRVLFRDERVVVFDRGPRANRIGR